MNTSTTHPTTSMLTSCDIAASRAWRDHPSGPAYVRGLPSWVWRSALSRRGGS